jgi:hypothetical protein
MMTFQLNFTWKYKENVINKRTDADNSPTNFIPGCWVIRWSSPFSISQNTCTFNRNSASEGVTHYVPKCITSVSQSDILCGDRVENFSSDCWLQNHLDQFGHNVQPHPAIPEEIEADYDDDSPPKSHFYLLYFIHVSSNWYS